MAITLTQEIKWLSKSILPTYCSWTSNESTVYDDYRYSVVLSSNSSTTLTNYSVIAQTTDLFGTIDPTQYIHSQLETLFMESGSTITNVPNQVGCYQMEITPYNNGVLETGNSEATNTFFVAKCANETLTQYYDGSLLVDHSLKKLTLDSYFSNQSYYGKFSPYLQDYQLNFDKIVYQITKPTGAIIEVELNNPYTYRSITMPHDYVDTTDSMLKLPVGPQNLTEILSGASSITITLPNGFVYYGMSPSDFTIENGETYRYATFLGTTQVSDWYSIEIVNCITRYDPVDLYFLNDNGAFDVFTFYAKNEESIKNKTQTHNKNPYYRVGDTIIQEPYDIGLTPYFDNISDYLTLYSDWLSDVEVQELRELWISPELYVRYGDEFKSVVMDVVDKPIYNKKNVGLSRYVVNLQFAEKRYRIR